MKRNFTFLIAALALIFSLAIPMGVWGQTSTYTFTSKSWAATLDGNSANWTSGKDGNQMQSGRGVQVTTGVSGANATSPVSFTNVSQVVITYSTNASAGAGSIAIQVGSNEAVSKSVTKTGGTTDRTLAYDFSPYQTGNVKFTVTCTTNSIYIKSIAITTSSGTQNPSDFVLTGAPVTLDFDLFNNNAPQTIYYTTSSSGLVSVEQNNYVNVTVDQQNKTITVAPRGVTNVPQVINVNQAAAGTYEAGSASFTVNITDSTPAPTYIFNTDAGLAALNITKPASNAGTNLEENHNYVSGDVTMTITHGTPKTRVWGGTSSTDLRVYGGGGSLTFSVPSGQQITSIILVGEKPSNFNEIGSKAEHTATWNGTPNRTVTLTANNTCQINTITVVYEANASGVDTPVLPASCNFQTEKEITITGITEGATVYYTTDNTDPKTSSTREEYTAPFTINATKTVKAVAYLNSNYSYVAEATYTRVYTITLNQSVGGSITASASQAAMGTEITLTATANVGYAFGSWTITPSVMLSGNTFTMPASDVTVSATFTQSTTGHTVSFCVNGKVEMTATVYDGSIDLTKFAAEGAGYTFEGWSTTLGGEIINPQNTYQPTGNITLYPGVAPAPSGDEYTLVTNVNDLHAGYHVVIAAHGETNLAMSTTQNNNNRGSSSNITKTAQPYTYITITENTTDVCEFTLGGSTGAWTFYDPNKNGYLYAASSSSNYLRTQTENDANGQWAIVVNSNGEATITAQGQNSHNMLRRNGNLFSCYESGQQSVFIYTKPASKSAKGNRDGVPTTSKVTAIPANVIVTVKADGIVYLTGSNAGNAANLVVEDGGQLVTSADVQGTMQKAITGYTSSSNGWYFISSSLNNRVNISDVQNLINSGNNYDLYYFKQDPSDGLEWINQKNTSGFTQLYVGSGYLYANAANTTLGFAGTLGKNDNSDQKPVDLTYEVGDNVDPDMQGWNLVGNPFPSYARVDRAFFRMKNTNDGINPEAVPANSVINPTEGVFVHASQKDEKVTFTATTSTGSKSRLINIDVARQGEMLDNAIVSLNAEGSLCKLVLNENTTRVYFHQDEKDYAILASSNENEVPVSFKASRNGSYTITVKPEDVEMNYLHLIDNMTGADVDLLANPSYTFEAKKTDYKSRFRLVFSANSIDEASTSSSFAYYNGTGWTVTNEGEATLQVVDVTGRIVSSEAINGCANVNINAANGVYMLRLVNGNNVKTQKIVVK